MICVIHGDHKSLHFVIDDIETNRKIGKQLDILLMRLQLVNHLVFTCLSFKIPSSLNFFKLIFSGFILISFILIDLHRLHHFLSLF